LSGTCTAGECAGNPTDCLASGFVFCDDFEDGVADGWTESGGTWSVLDESANRIYEGRGKEESWPAPSWADQTIQARVKVVSFGGSSDAYRAGIMARHSSASNFYTLQVRSDGSLSIRKSTSVVSGCNQVASGVNTSDWFTLRLEVLGPASAVSLRGYVNGQLKLSCSHTSGLASGQVGFVTYDTVARFDDITVTSP
jgi:pectate lyase